MVVRDLRRGRDCGAEALTPALHTAAPPRLPGDAPCGKRPRNYGSGRVCTMPGCNTILRRTHAGPVCDPCINNHTKACLRAMQCGSPASAGSEAACEAAPAARHEKEEKPVGTHVGTHGRTGEMRAKVIDLLKTTEDGISTKAVADLLQVATGTAAYHLGNLVADDEARVSCDLGYKVYRAAYPDDADPAPARTPAPAPVIPPPERPANVEAAPEVLAPQVGPPPFAGITSINVDCAPSGEIGILGDLERLEDDARERVLRYSASRWPLP